MTIERSTEIQMPEFLGQAEAVVSSETILFENQNFLPLIRDRAEAILILQKIIQQNEFSNLDMFYGLSATANVFMEEFYELEGIKFHNPEGTEQLDNEHPLLVGINIPLQRKSENQPYGFGYIDIPPYDFGYGNDIEINFDLVCPTEEDEERLEVASISYVQITKEEPMTLIHYNFSRDAEGEVICFRAETKDQDDDEDDEVDETLPYPFKMPQNAKAYIIHSLLSYLEHAPFGGPEIEREFPPLPFQVYYS